MAAALLALLPFAVHAHSTLKQTIPASGSVLTTSPPEVLIQFNEAARLTSVVAAAGEKAERKLSFEPAGSATSFTVKEPTLEKGRNEIRWKALSSDGHPIAGSIIIVIKPSAQP
jgi:methionine-rich copper-binding protein CopC